MVVKMCSLRCILQKQLFGFTVKVRRYSSCCDSKMRKFFVGGNWKMNGDRECIKKLLTDLDFNKMDPNVDVMLAPPAPYLDFTRCLVPACIHIAAQNCHFEPKGAFTGEISASMIKDIGANWVILGHSERRHIFKESNEMLCKKVKQALDKGLSIVFCVGETIEERKEGKSEEVVFSQMTAVLSSISNWTKVVIAYEPVWAIGTGVVATPEVAQDMHHKLRAFLEKKVDPNTAKSVRIIYGGSVTADNSKELAGQADIDGFLVGGASLKPEFLHIVNSKK